MIRLLLRTDAQPDRYRVVPIALGQTWMHSEGVTFMAYWTPGTGWVGDPDACAWAESQEHLNSARKTGPASR
jgi:hypothetical protein